MLIKHYRLIVGSHYVGCDEEFPFTIEYEEGQEPSEERIYDVAYQVLMNNLEWYVEEADAEEE